MASLVFDIGNTFIKSAVFERDEIIWSDHFKEGNIDNICKLINQYKISRAIISTVKKERDDWQLRLQEKVLLQYFNAGMAAGIRNHYLTPQTLGLDRLAAVTGAYKLHPESANLVVDAGTCITYDFVDQEGNYFGGSISPGLNMRYKALNHYTDGLPLVEADGGFNDYFGSNTLGAMRSGVQNGLKFEIIGFIESYYRTCSKLNIILTGGDSNFFDTLLKNSIFAPYIKNEPFLVLKGLNAAIQRDND